ncbi:MAG TPA: hypothetical protein VM889_02825 [Candidatus Thermoplasmatota archaeon]|nr:hypothetical protein [Candidatus Thermoplasmatota archaeon]
MQSGRALLRVVTLMLALALAVPLAAPQGTGAAETRPGAPPPMIDAANFTGGVDHPYFPLTPGTQYVYAYAEGGDSGRKLVTVTNETKTIQGVNATIVRETTVLEGEVVEVTQDWYAQDREGNVWYLGEDTLSFERRSTVSDAGSWEAGVANARAGIIMHATPPANGSYYQEYAPNVAEDIARDVAANHTLEVPFGNFTDVLVVRETDPLDGDVEWAYYAPDVGLIAEAAADGSEVLRLVEVRTIGERFASLDEWRNATAAEREAMETNVTNASIVDNESSNDSVNATRDEPLNVTP